MNHSDFWILFIIGMVFLFIGSVLLGIARRLRILQAVHQQTNYRTQQNRACSRENRARSPPNPTVFTIHHGLHVHTVE